MSHQEDRRASLLARRIPRADIEIGRAYVIHARNGGVGVAVKESHARNGHPGESLGYQLHREKFDRHYLFVEDDWDEGVPFGTAIPLALIEETPPKDETALLAWLSAQEEKHRAQIDEAWRIVLPPAKGRDR
jgi:hypothetical protein